jgi:hypothetical protein
MSISVQRRPRGLLKGSRARSLQSDSVAEVSIMKKSIVSIGFVSAIFCACLFVQSCAERTETTTYSEPPYYSSTTYGPYDTAYNSYPPYSDTRTTTYYTTTSEPDSVVGSTAHAAGTIIAAPFRLVGDALSIIF